MSTGRATFPALPPPSFPPVVLLPARRFATSTVAVPDGTTASGGGQGSSFRTSSTVDGGNSILCINETQYFWLQRTLRTTSTHGIIRAGFVLKSPQRNVGAASTSESTETWEVAVNETTNAFNGSENAETQVQMVAIRIEDATQFTNSSELAALSYVASHSTSSQYDDNNDIESEQHLLHSILVAADETNVYIVTPYDITTSMSLRDYCFTRYPNTTIVPEYQARIFTKQILKGLERLQNMRLCHRNLTLDSIVVRSKKNAFGKPQSATDDDSLLYCTIRNLENAILVPYSHSTNSDNIDDDDDDDDDKNETNGKTKIHLMTFDTVPPLLRLSSRRHGNGDWIVQFVPPELFHSSRDRYYKEKKDSRHISQQSESQLPTEEEGPTTILSLDGYANDLWAVGVMLLSMLLGNNHVFFAPIVEDRIFQQISIHAQLKEYYHHIVEQQQGTTVSTTTTTTPSAIIISDDALDLLQQMLRYDPKDRPTLHEIQQHPWFTVEL